MLTKNEFRVLDFLIRNGKKESINGIARQLKITPKGAYKILKKLERASVVTPENVMGATIYRPSFGTEVGRKLAEYVLVQHDLNRYAKVQEEDLDTLRGKALGAVLFGSILTKGRDAGDIDVLLILNKKNFDQVSEAIRKIQNIKPKKVHVVYQTPKDLRENLKKKDEVVLDILKTGAVLFGAEVLVDALKDAESRK